MDLAPFATVDRSALRWLRTTEEPPAYRLLSGEIAIAVLSWKRKGGTLAMGARSDGAWTFKRTGFLSPTIEVRSEGSERPVARLLAHLRHHEIRLEGGTSFTLARASRLLPAWRLLASSGEEVLHIEPVAERGSLRGGAVIVSRGKDDPATLLLVVLAWYFVALVWFEDELVEVFTALEGWGPSTGGNRDPPAPVGGTSRANP